MLPTLLAAVVYELVRATVVGVVGVFVILVAIKAVSLAAGLFPTATFLAMCVVSYVVVTRMGDDVFGDG